MDQLRDKMQSHVKQEAIKVIDVLARPSTVMSLITLTVDRQAIC